MFLNILRISHSNVLEMFLNVIVGCAVFIFHSYKPTGSTRTFIKLAANYEQSCTCTTLKAMLH